MNFATLRNSFYLNFLSSAMINLTDITTQLALTGAGRAGAIYLLVQTLLFAFALRSIFIGILYDIIVNKSGENAEEVKPGPSSSLDPETSYTKTQKPSPVLPKKKINLSPARSVRSPMKSSVGGYSEFAFSPDGPAKSTLEEDVPPQLDFTTVVRRAMQMNKKDVTKETGLKRLISFLTEKYKVDYFHVGRPSEVLPPKQAH